MDPGEEGRLVTLRRTAKTKFLDPLKTHGWKARIAREVGADSGYMVIEAERGGATHNVALMYASATRNEVYRQLASEVEHIFLNGQPYELESFTQGIAVPVTVADDFFDLLKTWNEATQGTVGIEPPAEQIEPVVDESRLIQSDNPIEGIWIRLRQLQSVSLAEKAVRKRLASAKVGDGAAVTKAEGLAFAVRNAGDYFKLRDEQGVSQRVLNLYYGTLSFAFAEMLAHPNGPATLGEIEDMTKQGHGLYTVDGPEGGLDQLVVGVIASGFFPRWMRFHGKDCASLPTKKPKTHSDLEKIPATFHATVERLFARIPDVGDLFTDIFDGSPAWVAPVYSTDANKRLSFLGSTKPPTSTYVDLMDRSSRLTRTDALRISGGLPEVVETESQYAGRHFRARVDHEGHETWWRVLPLHRSPFVENGAGALIEPLYESVTEFRSISLALLYGLSIIVRYRPSIWRRVQEGDLDQYRALIESFLSVVERVLPEEFLAAILGVRVHAKHRGGLF